MSGDASRTVWIVEDERNISEAIRFILERDGWLVSLNDTGAGVVEALREAPPALVILDVMLPAVSGLDILQALRAHERTAGVPVIMLTARGQADLRDRVLAEGASAFVAKPFSNAALRDLVRDLAGRR
ncbi:MAG: response regulator [Paracoccaceae bacterium]